LSKSDTDFKGKVLLPVGNKEKGRNLSTIGKKEMESSRYQKDTYSKGTALLKLGTKGSKKTGKDLLTEGIKENYGQIEKESDGRNSRSLTY
jgi:hypothetical protein